MATGFVQLLLKVILGLLKVLLLLVILALGYCGVQIHRADQVGRNWCDDKIAAQRARPTDSTATEVRETIARSERPVQLYSAEFVRRGEEYKCVYVVTGGLFPEANTYSSKSGRWEIQD
jgi:hypothetical protein